MGNSQTASADTLTPEEVEQRDRSIKRMDNHLRCAHDAPCARPPAPPARAIAHARGTRSRQAKAARWRAVQHEARAARRARWRQDAALAPASGAAPVHVPLAPTLRARLVHAARAVLETCPASRAQGLPFAPAYKATAEIRTATINWSTGRDSNVKVEVWDVVDVGKKQATSKAAL